MGGGRAGVDGWGGVVEVIVSFAGETRELHTWCRPDCLASEHVSHNLISFLEISYNFLNFSSLTSTHLCLEDVTTAMLVM